MQGKYKCLQLEKSNATEQDDGMKREKGVLGARE